MTIRLFCSYSREDESLRKKLESHLSSLKRQNLVTWYDGMLEPGSDWDTRIKDELDQADIIVLLVSPDFLASNYCYDTEVTRAIERHKAGTACVIPVLLRPTDTHGLSLFQLNGYPKGLKPVTAWNNQDEAFVDVVEGIRQAVKKLVMVRVSSPAKSILEAPLPDKSLNHPPETSPTPVTLPPEPILPPNPIEDSRGVSPTRRQVLQGSIGLALLAIGFTAGKSSAVKSLEPRLKDFSFAVVTVDEQGKEIHRRLGQAEFFIEDLGYGVTLEMVMIPGGQFLMGSPREEEARDNDESPQHGVTVSDLYMGKFVVTQTQYEVVTGENPSNFKGMNHPVENVLWENAINFCHRLSQITKRAYRLPSEAEWEYSCRARTTTPFHFGETITADLVNCDGRSTYRNALEGGYRGGTTKVGSFPANAYGLFDMHGNVWEWCAEHYHPNYQGAPNDGSAWFTNGNSNPWLLRGGSYAYAPRYCRSALRFIPTPTTTWNFRDVGFRVVLDAVKI